MEKEEKKIEEKGIKEEKKKPLFDFCIGNPPYQGDNHQQLYPSFYLGAKNIAENVEMIFPVGWQDPKNANNLKKMNNSEVKEDKQIVFIDNRQNAFPDVSGAEWTNVVLWKKGYDNGLDGKQKILTNGKDEEITKLLIKKEDIKKPDEIVALKQLVVSRQDFESVSEITSVRKPYGLSTDVIKDEECPKYGLPCLQKEKIKPTDVKVYGTHCVRYVPVDYPLPKNHNMVSKYKVFVPYAWGGMDEEKGFLGGTYADIIIGLPNEICTETYLESGRFNFYKDAENHSKYLLTKFCRALLYFNKYSRHSTTAWGAVPQQDYSEEWWNKSIDEIDECLFEKYGVPENIRDFVRKNIQPRTTKNIIGYEDGDDL